MMTLDEKRVVIELLLCGTDWNAPPFDLALMNAVPREVMALAEAARQASEAMFRYPAYEDDCCEAAYRLIESSPTLCREWFGAR